MGFDPYRMRRLLKNSGFSIPRLELTVRGTVVETADGLALRIRGLDQPMRLPDTEGLRAGRDVYLRGLLEEREDGTESLLGTVIEDRTDDRDPR